MTTTTLEKHMDAEPIRIGKAQLWTGRVLSALPVLMLAMSASMKLSQKPEVIEMFTQKFGYPAGTLMPIGIVELSLAALYAIPRTSVLGAILLTGYLGGAVATHVRVSDAFFAPIIVGVFLWSGLLLRDSALRKIIPLHQ